MLTAISVAQECVMIPPKGRVVLAEALPPHDGQLPTITWHYIDPKPGGSTKRGTEVREGVYWGGGGGGSSRFISTPCIPRTSSRCWPDLRHPPPPRYQLPLCHQREDPRHHL